VQEGTGKYGDKAVNAVSGLTRPRWLQAYLAALIETDFDECRRKIAIAEAAIVQQLRECGKNLTYEQIQDLEAARCTLRQLLHDAKLVRYAPRLPAA
jgi:hypothetical protein